MSPSVPDLQLTGGFDSSVHISEEASNASTAVPWAIVNVIAVSGVLGWGANTMLRVHIS